MSQRRSAAAPPHVSNLPPVDGTELQVEYVLDNLAAGRNAEELVAQHPSLTLPAIDAAKAHTVRIVREHDHSEFWRSLRIRHLMAALQPHPVVQLISDAFAGVRLGNGPSLRQMEVMDNYGLDEFGQPLTPQEYNRLKHQDVTHNW